MCRFADLIADTFGTEEGKIHGYPGHEEVEIGLVKAVPCDRQPRNILELAKYFVEHAVSGENYFMKEMSRPTIRCLPGIRGLYAGLFTVRPSGARTKTAEGHAVRAVYLSQRDGRSGRKRTTTTA